MYSVEQKLSQVPTIAASSCLDTRDNALGAKNFWHNRCISTFAANKITEENSHVILHSMLDSIGTNSTYCRGDHVMKYPVLLLSLLLISCFETKPVVEPTPMLIACQKEADAIDSNLDKCAGNEADLTKKLAAEKKYNSNINESYDQLVEDSSDVAEELVVTRRKLDAANAEIFRLHQRLIDAGLEQK